MTRRDAPMKSTITLIILLVTLGGSSTMAGTPTPSVDTVSIDGAKLTKFVARWNLTPTSTPDTLVLPGYASRIEITHKGAASGDTLLVSVAQGVYAKPYTLMLVAAGEKLVLDFRGAYVRRLYIKAGAGTAKAWVMGQN